MNISNAMRINLLDFDENGGCSAKMSARVLEKILDFLPLAPDPNILVNIDTRDDAGVYRVNDDLALVFTTDFFPPVCSDPYDYGQVAAANSISDIYAMGGTPVIALNIVLFPSARLPVEAYAAIIRGGFDKASEAGVRIIGGHTVDDDLPKYGMAVVGYIVPSRIITNAGAAPGDSLILTKPVGTGTIMAAARLKMAGKNNVAEAIRLMKLLNRSAADVMKMHSIRGATDITGFGLAGHALKMAKASRVSISLNMASTPLIGSVYRLADNGCIPGASFRNLDHAEKETFFDSALDYNLRMLAFDAQTSGGILMSVPSPAVGKVLSDLKKAGLVHSAKVGDVKEPGEYPLTLTN
jgi:selenide,water dikinase